MPDIYIVGDNIVSSLGFTSDENFLHLSQEKSGISMVSDLALAQKPVPLSLVDKTKLEAHFSSLNITTPEKVTTLEKMLIFSITDALRQTHVSLTNPDTLLILSSTKGNIELLNERHKADFSSDRVNLWSTADLLEKVFKTSNQPMIVSTACISGLTAIIAGARFMQAGLYKHIVVAGADVVSEFIVSGFQSFQSLSPQPCRPYDAQRDGLTLGEGAGTIVMSITPNSSGQVIRYLGGATSNDANHISGPSRTGDGLYFAIKHATQDAGVAIAIDYINAHGTATPFNDEMESKAITLAGFNQVPMNSLKGYWGHTLGAAGVIETIAGIHSLKHQTLIKTLGFNEPGLPHPLTIIQETRSANLKTFIKIASGFGGCNAAAIFTTS